MPKFDFATLALAVSFSCFSSALLSWAMKPRGHRVSGSREIIAALALTGLAMPVLAFRDSWQLGLFIGTLLPNIVLISAITLAGTGVMLLLEIPFRARASTVWAGIAITLLSVFTYLNDSVAVRYLVFNTFGTLFFVWVTYRITRLPRDDLRRPRSLLIALLLLAALALLTRQLLTMFVPFTGQFANGLANAFIFLPLILLVNCSALLMELIVGGKTLRNLAFQADRDALTGLLNRNGLDHRLTSLHHQPWALAVVDIDHFKEINDQHGHLAGDEVLREIGRRIAQCTRQQDAAARTGGEEFVVIAPIETQEFDVHAWADRIRTTIAKEPISIQTGALTLTVSVGCTRRPADMDFRSAYELADQALYRAKRQGRNTTIVQAA